MLYTKASITIPLTSCPIKLNKVRITGDILGTIIFKIKILKTPMIPPKSFYLKKYLYVEHQQPSKQALKSNLS